MIVTTFDQLEIGDTYIEYPFEAGQLEVILAEGGLNIRVKSGKASGSSGSWRLVQWPDMTVARINGIPSQAYIDKVKENAKRSAAKRPVSDAT